MSDTGGHEEIMGDVARVAAPSPGRGPRLRAAVRRLAAGSAQLILVSAGVLLVGYVAGQLWGVLLPVVLALLLSTVLWPAVRFLRAHRWPPAAAALTVLAGFAAAIGGIGALVIPPVVQQAGELAEGLAAGIERLQDWLAGPPLDLGEDQVGQAVDRLIDSVQGNTRDIAGYAVTAATAIVSGLVDLGIALVLTFFFLKDGPRWLPWLAAQTGPGIAPHVAALCARAWQSLGEFIRQQAVVGFADAFFIGLGLMVLGVPLVLPLTVLTFFGAFVPIVGALVTGAFAVLIALVSDGLGTALIVLAIVVVVQQVEGNVLQPLIQGRGFDLHPAVIILAVTGGAGLAGVIGAFLAVPVTALVAIVYRYARDALDGYDPEVDDDGTRVQIAGDDRSSRLVRAPAGDERQPRRQ